VVRKLQAEIPQIKILIEGAIGKNAAINKIVAASNSSAESIYFSDADVLVKRQTVGKALSVLHRERGLAFAAPSAVPISGYLPVRSRTPWQALFAEAYRIIRKEGMHILVGSGFAVRKDFIKANPLPEDKNLCDDIFINFMHRGKIRILKDAEFIFQPPNFFGRIVQERRNTAFMRYLLRKYPEFKEISFPQLKKERGQTGRRVRWFGTLTHRAKVGALIDRIALFSGRAFPQKSGPIRWAVAKSSKVGALRARKGK
jgi:hypothetical protein